MKKIALAVAAATLLASGAASAADLAARPYTKAPAPMAAVYNWTGFYIGAQVGGIWGHTDAVSGPFPGAFNQTYSYDLSGVTGGGHIGYNWQASNWVFGLEGDAEATSVRDSGIGTLGFFHQTKINWLASARARLGYAAGNTLLYVTGGAAFGDVEISKALAPGLVPFAVYSDTRTGWTVGAGVEHMFTPNWTARAEYRYTDLGSTTFSSVPLNTQDRADITFHAVRAGVSYKFGGPVVAKY